MEVDGKTIAFHYVGNGISLGFRSSIYRTDWNRTTKAFRRKLDEAGIDKEIASEALEEWLYVSKSTRTV